MFGFEKFHLTFSFNPVFFFIALLILAGYTIYVYRYTIPQIGFGRKFFLVSLRTLALLLLLFIFFEPVLTLAKKITIEPVNMIFVDNSRSIQIKDGTNRSKTVKDFINGLDKNNLIKNSELFTFGSKVKTENIDTLKKVSFNEGSTNFAEIFKKVKDSKKNISSVSIISDGDINEGPDPLYSAEKTGIPVYTIGVGDTSRRNDIEVKNVLYNQYIYAETPTTINATILNKGFANKNVTASLYEGKKLIEQKKVSLSKDGIQSLNFAYTPAKGGEKKLTVRISNAEGEFTYANNKKIFYVNVISNKVRVLLISGSPSADLSFIKNTLNEDKNLTVNSITQISRNRFLEKNNRNQLLDSADVLFLIGFPSQVTNNNLIKKVEQEISQNDKPYFMVLSNSVDFNKLRQMQEILGFTVSNYSSGYNEIQLNITGEQVNNPLLQNNASDILNAWNNLPPILQPDANFSAKPESNVIAKVKVNNVPINKPLIISRRLGNQKSIAVLAANIWRWKLQTVTQNSNLFDKFILNSVKWLNTKDNLKQVTIKTSKKLYSLGDQVEFTGQVYDEAFNPVSDANVPINIKSGKNDYSVNLNSVGNGLYEGTFQANKAGDYTFSGEALQDGKKLGKSSGRFNIGSVDIEMANPRMNYEFLKLLASQTDGKYFNSSNYSNLYAILKQINKTSAKEKLNVSEINLWSDEWLMIIAIIIFGLEWFFRKRAGML